jgi:hypothetical protein
MWSDVGQSVIGGVATGLTWAVLLFVISLVRNLMLERHIRRSFRCVGHVYGVESFGLDLTNTTRVPVSVWTVGLYLEQQGTFILNYSGTKSAHRPVKINIPGQKRSIKTTAECHSFRSEPEEGAVILDFDMSATWQMSNTTVVELHDVPKAAFCIVEYRTLIGTRKRMTIDVGRPDGVRNSFEHHRADCLKDPKLMNVKVSKAANRTV